MVDGIVRCPGNYKDRDLPYGMQEGGRLSYFERRQIDLSYEQQKLLMRLQSENVENELEIQKKGKLLDQQERSENRACFIQKSSNGTPIFCKEMLQSNNLQKRVAEISQCQSVIYASDEDADGEQILIFSFFNENQNCEDQIILDVTIPNATALRKALQGKGVKMLCGQKRTKEYSEALMDWVIGIAERKTLPHNRGFYIRHDRGGLAIRYIGEAEVTWKKLKEVAR